MTEDVLKGIRQKYKTVEELRAEIRAAYDVRHTPKVSVSLRSTRDLSGPTVKALDHIDRLQMQLEAAEDDYLTDCEAIEAWLLTIPDMDVVAIIRWHFLLGCNWRQTSIKVFKRNDYCYARTKYIRYIESHHIFEEEPE